MNLEEYEQFIKENGYYEEKEAINVVNVILEHHNGNYTADFLPRFIAKIDNDRLEFDLLILLKHNKHGFDRKIGVEFKETDISKVIWQAVARSRYVDYQYIATKNVSMGYEDIIVLSYFRIGWIVYFDGFAKMIFPAKFYDASDTVRNVVNFVIEEKIKKEADKVVEEVKNKLEKLDYWEVK